jgi:hypothetical protein
MCFLGSGSGGRSPSSAAVPGTTPGTSPASVAGSDHGWTAGPSDSGSCDDAGLDGGEGEDHHHGEEQVLHHVDGCWLTRR